MFNKIDDNLLLYNNVKIPCLGFGTWQIIWHNTAKESVKFAIKNGYRNIDTAQLYMNEQSVGEGIQEAIDEYGIKREELFISTKVWNSHRGYERTLKAFSESIKKLKLEYVDLYMIHAPAVEKWHKDWREINASTWKALERLYKDGLVKSIGVSNYLSHHIQALIEDTEIKPMVCQIEYHPGFGQKECVSYCHKNNIVVEAWSPLGGGDVLKNKQLIEIAEKYNKQPAQICIRWLLQKNMIPLPKSTHKDRIINNAKVFDFEISTEDMEKIDEIPYCGGMRFDPDTAKT